MKKKPSKEQLTQIISRIDALSDEDIDNEFIRLNPNSRDDFKNIFDKAVNATPDNRQEMINSSIDKFLLKKSPPISSMLTYFKTIDRLIGKTKKHLISKNGESYAISLTGIKIELSLLQKAINNLVMDIEKGYNAIIAVDFNNSKEVLLKRFDNFLSAELPRSLIHQKRKEIRLQNKQKLTQYLKVWELRKVGLTFNEISTKINENESTVKKQFCRAFELIYDCKYSKDEFIKIVIQRNDRRKCAECSKRSICTKLCEEVEKDIKSREKYQREKVDGDIFWGNSQIELDDILSDDSLDMDNEIDQES